MIMKTRMSVFLLVGGFVALAAWLVHEPKSAQAVEIPEKYRDTVRKGLEYLVKHQHKDGHWEGDDGKHPVAMTGLVGLALFMEREWVADTNNYKYKYADEIRKAVDWLLAKSEPGRNGLIFSNHPSETARYMQGHGLATLFLAAVLATETDEAREKKLREVVTRAAHYIVKAQSSQGGWYYTSKAEGHDLDVPS
jgi:squalene cyclase